MDKLLDTAELADFLGATPDDLKNWRRLPADHEGHLPSTLIDGRHRYDPDVVVAWLVKHPKRLALARFLFDERIALAHAAALRDDHVEPAPMPPVDAWDGYFAEQQPQQENPQ